MHETLSITGLVVGWTSFMVVSGIAWAIILEKYIAEKYTEEARERIESIGEWLYFGLGMGMSISVIMTLYIGQASS